MFGISLELISHYSASRHRNKQVEENVCGFMPMAESFYKCHLRFIFTIVSFGVCVGGVTTNTKFTTNDRCL